MEMSKRKEEIFIDESKKITMEEYSELFYEFSKSITQGCIVPIIPDFEIKQNENASADPFAVLIIENACNLVESEERSPKVSGVEYIILYDAKVFLRDHKQKYIRDIIQNRRFESELIYLPPHDMYNDYQKGFIGLCNYSRYIHLTTLKLKKQEKYICVKPPYRDYIKNKYIYFKLSIPLFTITDNEVNDWINKYEKKE